MEQQKYSGYPGKPCTTQLNWIVLCASLSLLRDRQTEILINNILALFHYG